MRPLKAWFIILLFALLGHSHAQANVADSLHYEEKLEKGIKAFYQTQWEEATSIFQELKSIDPTDSRAYFFDSMIPFWGYFFGGNESDSAQDFLRRSEKAIEVSRENLQDNPHDTTMVLMLSGLYGYRSLVAASEKNYRTAIQSGITGFTYTRQLLSIDADDPRALIGKGMFYYMVGSVPGELRWATNLMGMSGSVEEGFQILERAANSESHVSNDARMILSYLYKKEGRYDQAINHIQKLCDQYPQNVIFQYHYAELLDITDQTAQAKKAYLTVANAEQSPLPELRKKSLNRLQEFEGG